METSVRAEAPVFSTSRHRYTVESGSTVRCWVPRQGSSASSEIQASTSIPVSGSTVGDWRMVSVMVAKSTWSRSVRNWPRRTSNVVSRSSSSRSISATSSSSTASSRSLRRRVTLVSAVLMRLSRSTTRSVTSSALIDWSTSLPTPARRSSAVEKSAGSTLKVISAWARGSVRVVWLNTIPPRPCTMATASLLAAVTSSACTLMVAR